jgi:IS5 family transposase
MSIFQPSFFDESERFEVLSRLKDPLVELDRYIDFEFFRDRLSRVFTREKQSAAGRKPYDVVLMFKILILQRLYNLSDEQVEFQINDRCSFMRFLGLHLGSDVPDFSTVWRFREALTRAEAIKPLFDDFTAMLQDRGVITRVGTIVDASFVEVPKQRNSREENNLLKSGKVPDAWKRQPRKLRQKDVDARWTKKNQQSYYGYKNHVCADAESAIIIDYAVSHAAMHDSQAFDELIGADNMGEALFADSAYKSARVDEQLEELDIPNYIHEKAVRGRPLHALQIEINRLKSMVRCRVEHIFGCVENSMGGPQLEYIGLDRIRTGIGLSNLAYNLKRYAQLIRLDRVPAVTQGA